MCGHEIERAALGWQAELEAEVARLRRQWDRLRESQRDLLLACERCLVLAGAVMHLAGAVARAEDTVMREQAALRRLQAQVPPEGE